MINVGDIFSLNKWLDQYIIASGIEEATSSLGSALSANEMKHYSEKKRFIEALAFAKIYELNRDQIEFLKKSGIFDYLGDNAKSYVNFLFNEMGTAVGSIKAKTDTIFEMIEDTNRKLKKLTDILSPYYKEIEPEKGVKIYFHFKDTYNISDASDLASAATNLDQIFTAINKDAKIKLLGARKGSLILEFLSENSLAIITILEIFEHAQKAFIRADKHIKAASERVEDPDFGHIGNEDIDVEKIKKETMNTCKNLIAEFIKDKAKKSKAVAATSNQIFSFVEGGVEVEGVIDSSSEISEKDIKLIKNKSKEIRKDNDIIIKLLENK